VNSTLQPSIKRSAAADPKIAVMGDDEDAQVLTQTAREMLDRLGANNAHRECGDWARSADAAGDTLTAETWRDIADEIDRLSAP
jgi:hypothetical protein